MKLTYNSARPDLAIPEYGRSIHNMVHYCMGIEDREERNRCARAIIKTMGNLFPHLRDIEDFNHKLWDHLHVMADFKLDVDSPYPKPEPETFTTKPRPVHYPKGRIRYGHYGRTIEKIITEVAKEEDEEKRKELAVAVANLMKRSAVVWNQSTVKDEAIASDLRKLSDGKLIVDNPDKDLAPTREVMNKMGVRKNTQGGKRPRKRKGSSRGSRKKRN